MKCRIKSKILNIVLFNSFFPSLFLLNACQQGEVNKDDHDPNSQKKIKRDIDELMKKLNIKSLKELSKLLIKYKEQDIQVLKKILQLLNVGSIDEAIIKIKNFSDRQISIQKAQTLSYFMLSGDKILPYEKLKVNFDDAQWKNKNKEHVQKLCQAFGLANKEMLTSKLDVGVDIIEWAKMYAQMTNSFFAIRSNTQKEVLINQIITNENYQRQAQTLSYFMLSEDGVTPYEKLKVNFDDAQWKNKNKEHVQKLCQDFGLANKEMLTSNLTINTHVIELATTYANATISTFQEKLKKQKIELTKIINDNDQQIRSLFYCMLSDDKIVPYEKLKVNFDDVQWKNENKEHVQKLCQAFGLANKEMLTSKLIVDAKIIKLAEAYAQANYPSFHAKLQKEKEVLIHNCRTTITYQRQAQTLSYFMLSEDGVTPYEKLKVNFDDAQWKNKNKEHVQKLCQDFGLANKEMLTSNLTINTHVIELATTYANATISTFQEKLKNEKEALIQSMVTDNEQQWVSEIIALLDVDDIYAAMIKMIYEIKPKINKLMFQFNVKNYAELEQKIELINHWISLLQSQSYNENFFSNILSSNKIFTNLLQIFNSPSNIEILNHDLTSSQREINFSVYLSDFIKNYGSIYTPYTWVSKVNNIKDLNRCLQGFCSRNYYMVQCAIALHEFMKAWNIEKIEEIKDKISNISQEEIDLANILIDIKEKIGFTFDELMKGKMYFGNRLLFDKIEKIFSFFQINGGKFSTIDNFKKDLNLIFENFSSENKKIKYLEDLLDIYKVKTIKKLKEFIFNQIDYVDPLHQDAYTTKSIPFYDINKDKKFSHFEFLIDKMIKLKCYSLKELQQKINPKHRTLVELLYCFHAQVMGDKKVTHFTFDKKNILHSITESDLYREITPLLSLLHKMKSNHINEIIFLINLLANDHDLLDNKLFSQFFKKSLDIDKNVNWQQWLNNLKECSVQIAINENCRKQAQSLSCLMLNEKGIIPYETVCAKFDDAQWKDENDDLVQKLCQAFGLVNKEALTSNLMVDPDIIKIAEIYAQITLCSFRKKLQKEKEMLAQTIIANNEKQITSIFCCLLSEEGVSSYEAIKAKFDDAQWKDENDDLVQKLCQAFGLVNKEALTSNLMVDPDIIKIAEIYAQRNFSSFYAKLQKEKTNLIQEVTTNGIWQQQAQILSCFMLDNSRGYPSVIPYETICTNFDDVQWKDENDDLVQKLCQSFDLTNKKMLTSNIFVEPLVIELAELYTKMSKSTFSRYEHLFDYLPVLLTMNELSGIKQDLSSNNIYDLTYMSMTYKACISIQKEHDNRIDHLVKYMYDCGINNFKTLINSITNEIVILTNLMILYDVDTIEELFEKLSCWVLNNNNWLQFYTQLHQIQQKFNLNANELIDLVKNHIQNFTDLGKNWKINDHELLIEKIISIDKELADATKVFDVDTIEELDMSIRKMEDDEIALIEFINSNFRIKDIFINEKLSNFFHRYNNKNKKIMAWVDFVNTWKIKPLHIVKIKEKINDLIKIYEDIENNPSILDKKQKVSITNLLKVYQLDDVRDLEYAVPPFEQINQIQEILYLYELYEVTNFDELSTKIANFSHEKSNRIKKVVNLLYLYEVNKVKELKNKIIKSKNIKVLKEIDEKFHGFFDTIMKLKDEFKFTGVEELINTLSLNNQNIIRYHYLSLLMEEKSNTIINYFTRSGSITNDDVKAIAKIYNYDTYNNYHAIDDLHALITKVQKFKKLVEVSKTGLVENYIAYLKNKENCNEHSVVKCLLYCDFDTIAEMRQKINYIGYIVKNIDKSIDYLPNKINKIKALLNWQINQFNSIKKIKEFVNEKYKLMKMLKIANPNKLEKEFEKVVSSLKKWLTRMHLSSDKAIPSLIDIKKQLESYYNYLEISDHPK